jgi:hypothetical protein
MLARSLALLLTAVALLVAQQAAISHQIWHLAGTPGQAFGAPSEQQDKAPKKDGLCGLHAALGTVLGAVSGGAQAAQIAVSTEVPFIAADVPAARRFALAALSRGPPILL